MRILFLSHYFPPEVNAPAVRTHEHCREWVRQGHEVHVVTCVPNHPQGKVFEPYKRRLVTQQEMLDGIHVHRVWTYIAPNKGFAKRAAGYVSYMASAVLASLRIRRPDVVVATSPQLLCACAGHIASKLLRCPWVFEVRDIWPATIEAVGAIPKGTLLDLLEAMEMALYRAADRIVVVTEAFRQHLHQRGVQEKKISVVKNGVDLSAFDRTTSGRAVRESLKARDKFIISYVGTHGLCQKLETVMECARRLQGVRDLLFLFVGDGADKDRLVTMAGEMGLRNVTFMPQQTRAMVPEFLAASDICLVPLAKSDVFRAVLPSKIFEIMAAGKPIVLSVDGEARALVEGAGAGVFVPPEDVDGMVEAILRLMSHADDRRAMGEAGRRYVERLMSRERLARLYETVLRDTCRNSGPRRTVTATEPRC